MAHGPGQVSKGCPRSGGAASCCRYPLRRASIGFSRVTHPGGRLGTGSRGDPSGRHGHAGARRARRRRAGPPSRCSWCGGTCVRTSSAAPTCSPAAPSIPSTAGREAEALCAGRTDAGASALLGFASGGLAYWVAVVRETFEEAGLLLARRDGGPALLAGDPAEEARFAAERVAVNDGSRRFLDLCRDERLRLSVGDIHYFAHWITPRGAPRRYDTRFFVAAAPPGQIAAHDAGETIADVWISPHDALARHRAGEIEIIFPTIRNLQVIGRFATSAALLAAAEEASSAVPAIEPRVVPDGNGMRIVLPGRSRLRARRRPRPRRRTAAGRLQRGRARGLHAGQPRRAPSCRARAPPHRRRVPTSRDPGGAGLRHRARPRAGPPVDEVAPGVRA